MRTAQLRDLAVKGGLVGGPFGSNLVSADYVDDGVPVIRGENLGHGKWVAGSFAYVTPEKVERDLNRNTARPGDVVFTQRGTLGQVALVPFHTNPRLVISQSQMRLRPDTSQLDAHYLYYACSAPAFLRQVQDHAISTGVPHINLGILGQLMIPLPGLAHQKAIAEVLGALDDKIAANAWIASSVDELSETLFSRLQTTAQREGRLQDLLSLAYGKALPATSRRLGDVDVYGSGGIVGSHSSALCGAPGVVVGRKGTAGAVHWASRDFFPIDTAFFVQPPPGVPMEYVYFILKSLPLNELNSDSAVPGLNRNEAHALPVRHVDEASMEAFAREVKVLFARRDAAERESRHLANLRDALLAHLLSGRITVREAEVAVSDAV